MSSIQLKQLVPYILLLLSIFSISRAEEKEKSCKCSDSDQDRRSNYTLNDAGFIFHQFDKGSGLVRRTGLNFSRNISDPIGEGTGVLSTIDHWIQLWQNHSDHGDLGVDEVSFGVTIVYEPLPDRNNQSAVGGGLTFLIIPLKTLDNLVQANDSFAAQLVASDVGSLNLDTTNTMISKTHDYKVAVVIGTLATSTGTGYNGDRVVGVDIIIDPVADAPPSYSVWIDYDRVGRSLSVYVDVEGNPKPKIAIDNQNLNISSVTHQNVVFGLVSTVGQLLGTRRGINFTGTVDYLPSYKVPDDKGGFMSKKMTILFSVLGPVAATTVMAVGMACFFNSRYRQWQKDLDQLARSMERLPGVPTKVDFADINKATANFSDEMNKLGRGGFGTVYRCTLSAAACKTDRPMDVAIKRFTRDIQNHRYDDFLAEVSIINRLRHKNIVPLIGWSYNKGVPLLVFEYMTNGSLDQHLLPRVGSAIQHWATRYEIVRGIATGLHYVHHEYEPMVLHRDIKASNVMLDSCFRARLGDFGLACTVAIDRNSVTGVGGTWGYIAPEYAMCGKTTRQTDIYALGVLILEVVTGQRALADNHQLVDDDEVHITDRVWRLHREGRLSECVGSLVLAAAPDDDQEKMEASDDAARLLLLGLACSNPNPSDRPTMPEVVQVIAKSAPPPEVPPEKPRFVWPPPEGEGFNDDGSTSTSMMSELERSRDEQQVSLGQPMAQTHAVRRYASFQLQSAPERATRRHASFQPQYSV